MDAKYESSYNVGLVGASLGAASFIFASFFGIVIIRIHTISAAESTFYLISIGVLLLLAATAMGFTGAVMLKRLKNNGAKLFIVAGLISLLSLIPGTAAMLTTLGHDDGQSFLGLLVPFSTALPSAVLLFISGLTLLRKHNL